MAQRLSKRHGAVERDAYRDEGYLPEALLNYLVRLGWSHGDQEIFSIEEMIRALRDRRRQQGARRRSTPTSCDWLNQQYLHHGDPARIARLLSRTWALLDIDPATGPDLTRWSRPKPRAPRP